MILDEEKWAHDLAKKLNDMAEQRRVDTKAFVLREELKRAHGPNLWFEVKASVRAKAEALNKAAERDVFVCDITHSNKIVVHGRTIAEFNRETLTLQCVFSSTFERFSVKVDADSEVCFWSKGMGYRTVDQLAAYLIESNCLPVTALPS